MIVFKYMNQIQKILDFGQESSYKEATTKLIKEKS